MLHLDAGLRLNQLGIVGAGAEEHRPLVEGYLKQFDDGHRGLEVGPVKMIRKV
jgi:hypothetical protein